MGQVDTAVEERMDHLVSQLSLEQKVRLVSGADDWSTQPEPAIGLGRIVVSDGPAGVRGVKVWDEQDPSVSLPSGSAMAATWDEELIARLAELLAVEARRKGANVVLGPTVNLHRSPLGGRHFECFSEDPLLTGRLAASYTAALQKFGIGACPKHFVANDSETDRFTVDVRVDKRVLRELYLLPFEQAIEAGAWLVMSSFNRVNGNTMSESSLLTNPLKTEWGFDGVVISDWGGVRSTEAAGSAGNDLAMPGPAAVWSDPLVAAVREGRVSVAAIDDKVRRILRLAHRVGALDGVPSSSVAVPGPVDSAALVREAAASGMVLLRNEDALLPFNKNELRRVAVIGSNAVEPQFQGGGSVIVTPPYVASPVEGIRSALGDSVEVEHYIGVDIRGGFRPMPVDWLVNPYTERRGVRVRYLDSGGKQVRTEDRCTTRFIWRRDDVDGVASVEVRARLEVPRHGVYQFGASGIGGLRLEVDGKVLVDEVTERKDAAHDTFWGRLASLAHDAELFLDGEGAVDLVLSYQMSTEPKGLGGVLVLSAAEPAVADQDAIDAAVTAAKEADIAIVVVGTTERHESEGFDRTTLALPGRQNELIAAVVQANPRSVVVINSGAPVELPWHADVPAILLSWFAGQEFGSAVADVLFGDREPGGRLPTTWGARQDDVPVLNTQPSDGTLTYEEGLHVGYRGWARAGTMPAYPFGHGLGYTNWEYRSVRVEDESRPDDSVIVRVRLANTGQRVGREVVQVYLSRPDSSIERPVLWLAGFAVVTATAGAEVETEVEVQPRAFQHWSAATHQWETEAGTFTVRVGRSAVDLPLRSTVTVVAES